MDAVTAERPASREAQGSLGILAQRLHGRVTGVGRYLGNLLDVWVPQMAAGGFPFARIVLISREPLEAFAGAAGVENRWRASALPDAAWEQVHVSRLARGLAVLFCPSYTGPLRPPCPMVVATLDMLQVTRAADFPRRARLVRGPLYRLSARRAEEVITLAEATVPEIVSGYGIAPARVHAIPLAADPRFTDRAAPADDETLQRYGLERTPFVLFVGKLAARRHIPELIAGFTRAVSDAALPHRLVLAGPDPQRLFDGAGGDRVRYLGHVPDVDLPVLYRRADLVAYLSEDEGFGLPIVEAMRSGTPVLALDRPVLREVGGAAVEYLGRATPETVASALRMLLGSGDRRRALAAAGLVRARGFDWATTAARTLDVLTRAASRRASQS